MKNFKQILLFLMVAFAFSLNAQSIGDYLDVVHFKNGSSVKGVIIEQVLGESVKIKALDGEEYVYNISNIAKFSRELSDGSGLKTNAEKSCKDTKVKCSTKADNSSEKLKWSDDFYLKKKGFFREINLLAATNAAAVRILNGYRFGRFGNIGIALGIENIATARKSMAGVPEATINLVYFGELFNKRITPFYQIEAGYGVALKRTAGENKFFGKKETDGSKSVDALFFGGPMSGLVLGFKFKSKKKVVFKLGLDARLVSQFSSKTHTIIYEDGSTKEYKKDDFEVFPGLGARFGIGF